MDSAEDLKDGSWQGSAGSFSPAKYVLRIRARPRTSTIRESDEHGSSVTKSSLEKSSSESDTSDGEIRLPLIPSHRSDSSGDSVSSSSHSVSNGTASSATTTTTSRMENGERLPRLAAGVYYKKPTPILGDHVQVQGSTGKEGVSLPASSRAVPSVEMRGPPPAWQPPCPPDPESGEGGTNRDSHDYENNYEDPEQLRRHITDASSRDLLMTSSSGPPPIYNSYEMSLSAQRRSNAMTASVEDWDEPQRVLHKNSEGTYYIPAGTGSVRTTTSTLSPASQIRYHDQCPTSMSCSSSGGGPNRRNVAPSTASLLKYNTTVSLTGTHINKKRSAKMPYLEKEPLGRDDSSSRRPSSCVLFLAVALIIALIAIILLLLRSPSYVYSERSPSAPASPASRVPAIDDSQLRPLPSVISIGQRTEADFMPKHMATTELFMSRPGRVRFNVTLGAGSQLVLLGRHSVPPSLYLHDFFRPLTAEPIGPPKPSHSVEHERTKRQTYDIMDPRSAIVEEFLLEGRWHLMFINERNRVEPLALSVALVPAQQPAESPLEVLRCEQDCSGHGECLQGKCRCAHGYMGDACEDAVCPVVCSGNGVFSGGLCVCKSGFKGKECDLRTSWCEVPDCSGHGRCSADGNCRCERGWTGDSCQTRDCLDPRCNDHGVCVHGLCYCTEGWKGTDCATQHIVPPPTAPVAPTRPLLVVAEERPRQVSREAAKEQQIDRKAVPTSQATREHPTPSIPSCGPNGRYVNSSCGCDHGWTGSQCHISTCPDCEHGVCSAEGVCECFPGWHGANCDGLPCAIGCEDHGTCSNDGICKCNKGWNGDNCYIDGCPHGCSGSGECVQTAGSWQCKCQPGRTGRDCAVPVETDCNDGMDNDNDELTDCDDPECCSSDRCRDHVTCASSPDPAQALLRLSAAKNEKFAQRVAFLYQNDIQKYADSTKFNESLVSVVRGRVVWDGGVHGSEQTDKVPLVGVRVSDALVPLWGFTLSRIDGHFDLVVNGGQTVQLRFQRNPFVKTVRNIYVPPNEMFHIGDVQLFSEKHQSLGSTSARPQCLIADRLAPQPVVRATWRVGGTDGAAVDGLMVDSRSVVERIPLPGCSVSLVYDSSRVAASPSSLVLGLLPHTVDPDLRLVHLQISVAGRIFTEKLAPRANLTHIWSWDKQNAYRQSENGLVNVHVRIGYEYRGCGRDSEILWVERSEMTDGATSRRLEGNAWSLDIHHHLDVVNSVLEMGNGGRRFLAEATPAIETFAGTGTKRELDCAGCQGQAEKAQLLRPSTLAYSLDGSLFIGDHELIRRVAVDGNISTVLQLSTADTSHSYHLAASPLDGSLYVSLSLRKQIWKITTMDPSDVASNYEVIAGDGTTCTSHGSSCGDGGPATEAQLVLPKGISFDAQGNLYVADGRRVRVIDVSGSIRSIGDHSTEKPPHCGRMTAPLAALQLEWPTAVSVHSSTGLVYVLDSNVVYEIDERHATSSIVLGSLSTCSNSSSIPIRSAKDIFAAADGSIYVVESDGKHLNQIRRLSSDRLSLGLFAGQSSACSCDVPACGCDEPTPAPLSPAPSARKAQFNGPSAVVVSPHGDVYVADTMNIKVKKISRRNTNYDPLMHQFTVVDAQRNELLAFNRHGLHTWTQSLNTGKVLYNFTYNVDTVFGRLSSIHGAGELLLRVIRSNETHTLIESPLGPRTRLIASVYDGTIEKVQLGNADPIKLHYSTGGLLISRAQSGRVVSYGYDDKGRAIRVRRDAEGFELEPEQMVAGRYETRVTRNGEWFATYSQRENEVTMTGSSHSRLVSMDDGFLVSHRGMTSLLDAQTHPNHAEMTIMKTRTTIPSVVSPSRRELTFRFDWRPFVKKGSDRRVAEVGNRPRINGVNTYTVSYERAANRDVIRARNNEEELLSIEYTESGELAAIRQPADEEGRLANLSISYDSLGRRSAMRWGNYSVLAAYDRQNRIMEKVESDGGITKFGYQKDQRLPTSLELPGGAKFTVKLDSRGRIRDVTTSVGETHSFVVVPTGGESILLRRYPFTKKPFRVGMDERGDVIDWATPDDLHQKLIRKDAYGRISKTECDGTMTSFNYDSLSRLTWTESEHLSSNTSWQGPLISQLSLSRNDPSRGRQSSSFSYEYDDMLRPTSIQAIVEGTAIEPIHMTYDERSALLSSVFGYQILRESTIIRIQGYKLLHESLLDEYRQLVAQKVVVGDVRVSQMVTRDATGRVSGCEWKTPRGTTKETNVFDGVGRTVSATSGNERWVVTYNNDGRPTTMNDVSFEWHAGGVPKKVGRTEYLSDASGWIIRRGQVSFEFDCDGRVTSARDGLEPYNMEYDSEGRLVWLKRGSVEHSFFYAHPAHLRRVSHFSTSGSGLATILYTDDGTPFAMVREGYRYAIVTDGEGSLRYVLAESGVAKEVVRNPFGAVTFDSDSPFWLPIGYRGGVELPSISLCIVDGRPLDTLTGRFLSFDSARAAGLSFGNLPATVDLYSSPYVTRTVIPTDMSTWFRLVGLSATLLPPDLLRISPGHIVSSRSLASFPSRLAMFSTPLSIQPSALLERSFAPITPSGDVTLTVEDPGFSELFLLVPGKNTTTVDAVQSISADDVNQLTTLFGGAVEIPWRQYSSGIERHFVRSGAPSTPMTSESRAHYTMVSSSERAELRSGKARIVVHYGTEYDVLQSLAEDAKRRDGPSIWRAEKRRAERGDQTLFRWSDSQKRELVTKGAVLGYGIELRNPLNARFLSAHQWRFVPTAN